MEDMCIDQEFELPVKLIEQIQVIVKENNISKDEIVAEAIRSYLSKERVREK